MRLESIKRDIDEQKMNEVFFSDYVEVTEKELSAPKVKNVELDLVKGSFKEDFHYEKLYDIACCSLNKNITINKYKNKKQFEKFLQKENRLPLLIFLDGNYYIWGDGNHRIVLAKLIGIDKAKAIVFTPTPKEEKKLLKSIN